MQLRDALFSSESVTEGHPDKVCDQISDAVLDECLRNDRTSRVALETAVKTGLVVLVGEITTRCTLDEFPSRHLAADQLLHEFLWRAPHLPSLNPGEPGMRSGTPDFFNSASNIERTAGSSTV